MNKVKVFRITGKISKPNFQSNFKKEVRALKHEDAVEEIYKEIGSNHKAKRHQIIINKVEEINKDEIEDSSIRKLTLKEYNERG